MSWIRVAARGEIGAIGHIAGVANCCATLAIALGSVGVYPKKEMSILFNFLAARFERPLVGSR